MINKITHEEKINLNPAIKRYIKHKEKELSRKCRMIWKFENTCGDKYLFANFCKNWDRMVVTIGYFYPPINSYITPR